jgi:heavy metal sensor kinase
LIVFSLIVWLILRHMLYADFSAMLVNQARGFEEYLHIEEKEHASDLVREMDEFSKSLPQDHLLMVYDASENLIYSNKPVAAHQSWEGGHYFEVRRSIALDRGPVKVVLSISTAATDRAVTLLGWLLALAVPFFALGAAGGGYWLSRKALLPVDGITERARLIGIGNLSERLDVPQTRDELQRLTETWNAMLARLDAAVSRISRFTADASHELRTPVAIIRLAAENALRKSRPEIEYRTALARIQRESENMTCLIDDLLFLARADVEQSSAAVDLVDLRELVRDVCSDVAALAAAKNLTVNQQVPAHSVSVAGRTADLRRMLLILLDNAVKYTPEEGFIRIQLDQADDQAILRIEDSGIGIPEEARTRVFQRFFRVDPSRSKESGGYGLGLAIAQAIVQRHNASIELQSNAAGGCIFSVSMPVAA